MPTHKQTLWLPVVAVITLITAQLLAYAPIAKAQSSTVKYVFRPHCASYAESSGIFGEIPAPGFVLDQQGGCRFFNVSSPELLEDPTEYRIGDLINFDLTIHNPSNLPISDAKFYVSYDSTRLEGENLQESFDFDPVPDSFGFNPGEGLIEVHVVAEEGLEPTEEWIRVAEVTLRAIAPGDVPLSAYDPQPGGHTSVQSGGNSVLDGEPSSLLLHLIEAPATQVSSGSEDGLLDDSMDEDLLDYDEFLDEDLNDTTCIDNSDCISGSCVDNKCTEGTVHTASDDSCTQDSDCDSGICYENTCQDLGFKIPDGGSCRRDNQCLSLWCNEGICSTPSNLADGESCASNDECSSGNCEGGLCASSTAAPAPATTDTTDDEPMDAGALERELADDPIDDISDDIDDDADTDATVEQSSGPAPQTAFSLLKPQNVRITTEGDAIYLQWDELPSSQLKGYNIYYGSVAGQYIQRRTVPGTVASDTIAELPEGTTYYIAIRGVSKEDEETAFSDEVSVQVGDPTTASALLASVTQTDNTPAPVTTPIKPGKTDRMPGETGLPSMVVIAVILAAITGTVMAARRQVSTLPFNE